MFTKELWDKYADVVIWSLYEARKNMGGHYTYGDMVMVHCDVGSLLLAEAVYKKLLLAGLQPLVRIGNTPQMNLDFYKCANDEQLSFAPPWSKIMYQNISGSIYLRAPAALRNLEKTDPRKVTRAAEASAVMSEIIEKREMQGKYGWTLCTVATEKLAKQSGLTMEEYEAEIIKACYLGEADPVGVWKKLAAQAAEIGKWLKSLKVNRLRVESANVDLKVTIGQSRRWIGINGYNMPSFEIFTCPDWRGTSGRYFANTQSLHDGHLVRDVRLVFKQGVVVEASAAEGEKFLKYQLTIPGADKLGEFSLTDKRFSPISKFMADTLFDENVGQPNGNCHVAIGHSFPDTYDGSKHLFGFLKKRKGFNDSPEHWDLINTEPKRVTAHLVGGQRVIYEDGQFRY